MKIEDMITEQELTTRDMSMGLFSMRNNEVALVGGMRSGNSAAGKTRLKFMIYDMRGVTQQLTAEEYDERESGIVELFVFDGTQNVEGLVNIEIKPKMRRSGIGRIVIQSLADTFDDLRIYDIKKSAVPFWRKMGATFYSDPRFSNPIDNISKARGGAIFAII